MSKTRISQLETELATTRQRLEGVAESSAQQMRILVALTYHARALAVLNAALLTELGGSISRTTIREAALAQFQDPADAPAAELVRQLTGSSDLLAEIRIPVGTLPN